MLIECLLDMWLISRMVVECWLVCCVFLVVRLVCRLVVIIVSGSVIGGFRLIEMSLCIVRVFLLVGRLLIDSLIARSAGH